MASYQVRDLRRKPENATPENAIHGKGNQAPAADCPDKPFAGRTLFRGFTHGEFVSQTGKWLAVAGESRLESRKSKKSSRCVLQNGEKRMSKEHHCVFISGGTGYMGQRLIPRLLARGHEVRALVRPGSENKLPQGCTPVVGNALDGESYVNQISPADTFVQLVGVAHPSPAKGAEFRQIDLPAGLGAVHAAKSSGIRHFIYVSVAHPAPMMHAYIAVRMECEAAIASAGLNATILRPWYVLGPGHRWPHLLVPLYKLAGLLPQMRDGALRMGLVTLDQMLNALTYAVENPVLGTRVVPVPEIRAAIA